MTGLWMFACVALLMVITGLPAWSVLIGVAGTFSLVGVGFEFISISIYHAMPAVFP